MLLSHSRSKASASRCLSHTKFRGIISSKPGRTFGFSLICLVLLFFTNSHLLSQELLSSSSEPPGQGEARLHLWIPATSSNLELCKLLLSVQILGYPTPILINYGATEAEDPYVQHLAKVQGILDHLNRLEASTEAAEDVVLIVDGYDVWFQLPPDILLSRYYRLIADADARAAATYGSRVARANDMRHTVVFGPDKICWPIDFGRPACWAVPLGTLALNAFGPATSEGRETHNLPRWLNSGTIMGPARDLKGLFHATLDEIQSNHTTDSDQFYLAEVFGRQEYARLRNKPKLLKQRGEIRFGDELLDPEAPLIRREPTKLGDGRTEYHITIDYESALFQTVAFWKQYLVWMRPMDSWPQLPLQSWSGVRPYQLELPDDIRYSRLPIDINGDHSNVHENHSWESASLLYNTVTQQVPAAVHFTGDKSFRHLWWRNVWFLEAAEYLRKTSLEALGRTSTYFGRIHGYTWYNAEPQEAEQVHMRGLGGAWSDRGGWFSWKSLCKQFEHDVYSVPSSKLFHASLEDADVLQNRA